MFGEILDSDRMDVFCWLYNNTLLTDNEVDNGETFHVGRKMPE
jgi:hypothetical protein